MSRYLTYTGIVGEAMRSFLGWTLLYFISWMAPLLVGLLIRVGCDIFGGGAVSAPTELAGMVAWIVFLFPFWVLGAIVFKSAWLLFVPLYAVAAWALPLQYSDSLRGRAAILGTNLIVSTAVCWWTGMFVWVGLGR